MPYLILTIKSKT